MIILHIEATTQAQRNENTIVYLMFNLKNWLKMEKMMGFRMTCLYFVVGGLNILKAFETESILTRLPFTKEEIIEWIYEQQIGSESNIVDIDDSNLDFELYLPYDAHKHFGFRGGPFLSFQLYRSSSQQLYIHINDIPELASTYSALSVLLMLGDDLSRVNKRQIIDGLKYYQTAEGKIRCMTEDTEDDVRFMYWAAAIHYILINIDGIQEEPSFDVDKLVEFITQCASYDGAFGWNPHCESHSGLTYWTLGALKLLNRLDSIDHHKDRLIEWLVSRQQLDINGFNGRINKVPDTCYSFWNTASLAIIDPSLVPDFIHNESIYEFIESCIKFCGYAKTTSSDYPDILHTFYSLAYLALSKTEGMNTLDPVLALPITDMLKFPKDKLFID